jgi:hypothetical protein
MTRKPHKTLAWYDCAQKAQEEETIATLHALKRAVHARIRYLETSEDRRRQREDARWLRRRPHAHQAIDIAYKALAKEMHPDTGGSHEAMARLEGETRRRI